MCPGGEYCLPVYVRCNDVFDCPGHEDEAGCDSYTCPGFFRCRKARVCLHPDHVCDDIFQCPQHDDELLCDATCPDQCVCHGLAFVCPRPFNAGHFPRLRYLDALASGMTHEDVVNNTMLIHLSLARCQLRQLLLQHLPNLHSLDLSDNNLTSITSSQLHQLGAVRLRELHLARNPLTAIFTQNPTGQTFSSTVRALDLSGVAMQALNVTRLVIFPSLEVLNLSETGVDVVLGEGFQPLPQLTTLDLRGCEVSVFPRDIFRGNSRLRTVHADNFKLCCSATLPPGLPRMGCQAPRDSISSCDALLRSDVYRVSLAIFACLALLGNMGSFVYRVMVKKMADNMGFDVSVTHLCVSDFLMGVYLAVIGVADYMYLGSYLWEDTAWKKSTICKMAGFVSLLSNEVSAFTICLITLERVCVFRFPFSSARFSKKSAQYTCAVMWIIGLLLASVPLFPLASQWQFYGQTGICIPLPITAKAFQGHGYSFGVMTVLNFVLFLLIAVGQVIIYWSVQQNSMPTGDPDRRSRDMTIARRLFTIVMSDFLCWFPVGLLGILASRGIQIPGEVNVAMAIFVLPFNSALNPFLYTYTVIVEKRRIMWEERLRQRLKAEFKQKVAAGNRLSVQP